MKDKIYYTVSRTGRGAKVAQTILRTTDEGHARSVYRSLISDPRCNNGTQVYRLTSSTDGGDVLKVLETTARELCQLCNKTQVEGGRCLNCGAR